LSGLNAPTKCELLSSGQFNVMPKTKAFRMQFTRVISLKY